MYDFIIIGGGISGFYCALELIKHKKNVVLCEKYKNLGGRIDTFHENSYTWESGAGRISKKHTMLLDLMKKYNEPLHAISPELTYKKDGSSCIEPNLFEPNINAFFEPLQKLDSKILNNSTLKELCIQIHGKDKTEEYFDRFPYRAETEVLRADLGLESFKNEMGSHQGYYVAVNGLHSLIEKMEKDFLSKGGEVLTNYECFNIQDKKEFIETKFYTGPRSIKVRPTQTLQCSKLICAMTSEALKHISFFNKFTILKHLRMEPLLRTYAVYDNCWFSQFNRIVTKTPIRYFLPINYNEGSATAMVSYTDSRDTNKFHKIIQKFGEESLGKHIQNLLKELFGPIPEYKFFKSHYWKYGATYWLPGNYDPIEESKKSLKPFESEVYIVGESFSLKQAWIEGALEQCKKLFHTYRL
uniref:Amine oxidase domain-containing protein n=1 Tax=viral metagenome TaxID=1070528 RepID=A0A6C0D7E9_9ZZZZ